MFTAASACGTSLVCNIPTCKENMVKKTCGTLQPKTIPCGFIGYSSQHKGYRCLHQSTGKVYISRHIVLDESKFSFENSSTSHNFKLQIDQLNHYLQCTKEHSDSLHSSLADFIQGKSSGMPISPHQHTSDTCHVQDPCLNSLQQSIETDNNNNQILNPQIDIVHSNIRNSSEF